MRILIEEQTYPTEKVRELFQDKRFYIENGPTCKIVSVGYYYSFERSEVIYILPKVFMKSKETTIFDISPEKLLTVETIQNINSNNEFLWARKLLIFFYQSLIEYRLRNQDRSFHEDQLQVLSTNLGQTEFSFLDLILSILKFHKKNKNAILFKHVKNIASNNSKTNWPRTITKTNPLFLDSSTPVYHRFSNRNKVKDYEEELISMFYSVIAKISTDFGLNIKIDKSIKVYRGTQFSKIEYRSKGILRKIKHRYFTDIFKKMFNLCEIYFDKSNRSSSRKKVDEFISINNYNLIFEDMVDDLLTDEGDIFEDDILTSNTLKKNKDGKIIDHIFKNTSLVDNSTDIFYIGDSKYYKPGNNAGANSKYKQITYAKNVLQVNIDLFNKKGKYPANTQFLEKEITEGYNIIPNFFIYGNIGNHEDFNNPNIEKIGQPNLNFHFHDRLFDRDTLFVQQYEINFLYVLSSYTHRNYSKKNSFRMTSQKMFRSNMIEFFNNTQLSGFELYKNDEWELSEIRHFVNENFRILIGKCFLTKDFTLLVARHIEDESLFPILEKDFKPLILT